MARSADVIVVGAGPAGASTAHYLALAGLDVLVLEKATFPRDKICGDGLTPRAVAELIRMGVNTDGWARNHGLRTYGGGHCIEVPWPELASMPNYGVAAPRMVLDEALIRHAQRSGARLEEGVSVAGALTHPRTGRIVGVTARQSGSKELQDYTARYVVDAGGVSARLAEVELPKYDDNEATFAELQALIAKVLAFIDGFKPEQIDGKEGIEIITRQGTPKEKRFTGQAYLLTYGLPQFFFHITTAYAILRHNGVVIGKRDYMGAF